MEAKLYESISPILEYNDSIRNSILDICKPLFDNFDITYFEYDKISNDGRVFYLCTNKEWLQFSLEQKMFDDEEHVRLCSIAKNHNIRYALWNTLKLENTHLLSKYRDHNIWNGLTINEIEEDSFNTYSFATTKENTPLNNFFINNLFLFDHFILYFKNKIKSVPGIESKILTFSASPLRDEENSQKEEYNHRLNNFLKQTELCHFEVKEDNKIITITKREAQCLWMLSEGKTMKEIAQNLEISQRTVESYLNTVKRKTGATFKTELIAFFDKSSLKHYKHL